MPTLVADNEPSTPEVQGTKSRKKSMVWEHFTVEDVGDGCTRACCKQCKQTFAYSTGTKVIGTSHLKRHIANGTCLANLRKEKNQLKSSGSSKTDETGSVTNPPRKRYKRSSQSVLSRFDPELCRHELAKMIIMHEYPLHMVEHPAFRSFVRALQPQFNMVDFDTVQGDCVAIYQKGKQELLEQLTETSGRVSLSMDLWSSSETLGYIVLTIHFIGARWRLHSRILSVVMVPSPHSKDALARAVGSCVAEWGLENKLFSLSLNKSTFRGDVGSIRGYMSVKNSDVLNGQLLVEHCFIQVLSSMVLVALGGMQQTVNKVRETVKYVKTSEAHEEKFLTLKHTLQVPSTRCLTLDDHTQWNTTFDMLVSALELKEVLSLLDTVDPGYVLILSMDDWREIDVLCAYLKLMYDSASVLSTATQPTVDMLFHEAWKIRIELMYGSESRDPLTYNLANSLREKFDVYWKSCSLMLAIAVILDPQFKMKIVELSFSKIYRDEAIKYIGMVDQGIRDLFSDYAMPYLPLMLIEHNIPDVKMEEMFDTPPTGAQPDEEFFDSDDFINELSNPPTKSELDIYLEVPVIPYTPEFDILSWWDLNSIDYPALSKLARDILSIPVSAVARESVFSTIGSRRLNRNLSSLQPETVQALVCAKDWLRFGSLEPKPEPFGSLVPKPEPLKTELLGL